MNYWQMNVQAIEFAFLVKTGMELCDLPDIVCMDEIGIVDDRQQTREEIAECLDYLMEIHADDCSLFAEAFGF